jgi:hypothetical protein
LRKDYKGIVSLIIASGLVVTLLVGVGGIIWRGDKLSTQGSVVIGMVIGAVTIIGAGYLGIYLTYFQIRSVRQLWPGEKPEDTLEQPPRHK